MATGMTTPTSVSYTHLDVYKRQALNKAANCSWENSATSQLPGRLSKIRQTIPGIASAITVHSREK